MNDLNSLTKELKEADIFKPADKKELQDRNDARMSTVFNKLISRSDATKNSDGSYSFTGDVEVIMLGLTSFPIRFKDIRGHFYCGGNKLTSLEGSPKTVGEDFNCNDNELISLEGAPRVIGGSF